MSELNVQEILKNGNDQFTAKFLCVEANTNKRIKNLVDPSTLIKDTAAVLVNAIFFKGNWQIQFKEYMTRDRDFFVTINQKLTIPMMHQSERFKYGDSNELDAKLLEMSYEGGETSFVIVLPKQYDGIESLIEKLKDPAAFSKARSNMYKENVHVSLPKFKIETTTDLKEVLQRMNIEHLFVEGQAQLNNLIEDENNLYVSDAIQKAFIEVDEKGTEAAAANILALCALTSMSELNVQEILKNGNDQFTAEFLYVEANTNERIKDLVDPSTLSSGTVAVLVNAIFFKGNWQIPFQKHSTRDRAFFVTSDQTVTIPMMHQSDIFKYGVGDVLHAKLLEMSYEGGETSFVVVLPKQYDGMELLIEKLKDPAAFSNARTAMYSVNVHVSLPKFKIETTTNLKEILQKIKIRHLFVEGQARLDNLIEAENNLYVSDAIQKAFIEVYEKGTEAAAANMFGISIESVGNTPIYESFDADHPFVFYLTHHDNILFNGVFRSKGSEMKYKLVTCFTSLYYVK
ncbi:unnamed protein product [Arctia plantaginis]|uniref:Serpin domain-containing protein n=1 Tax=Arctia plantaginis TaxID=874455 RepID=A0A8S1AH95_ARCPL|nr:unnamed protein product [Arctia plantaginis]